jgi:hypothetical protein
VAGEEDSEDDEDAETEAGQPGDLMETPNLPAAASLHKAHIHSDKTAFVGVFKPC